MRAVVVLNAGGAGTRMSAAVPKPLVEVLGVPLVERNLLRALGAGARRVVLVSGAAGEALRTWAADRAAPLCTSLGAEFECRTEAEPRGTIACLGELPATDAPVMMLYADNLTALDLSAFDAAHERSGADVTLAVHEASFDLPFGRVDCDGDRVRAYTEKPRLPVPIASGAYILSPAARAALPAQGRCDAPELVRARLASGAAVQAFHHAAAWIDVNDPPALLRAAALIASAPELERFVERPAVEVCGAVLTLEGAVLLEHRPAHARLMPDTWDTPGGKVEPGETPQACITRELSEELGLDGLSLRRLATFDDLDPGGTFVRHHVVHAPLSCVPTAREGQTIALCPLAALPSRLAGPAHRSLAWFGAAEGGR